MTENYAVRERGRVERAKVFAAKWVGRGYEKGDTHSFWLELLRDVVGMEDVTTHVRFESPTSGRGFIDVSIPDAKTIIEQKSVGVDLDKPELRQGVLVTPFEQAKRYVDSMRNSQRADTIIVCDFNVFRIHDLDTENPAENYTEFHLAELPEQFHLLDFLADPQRSRQAREERVSLEAGALIGRLYEMLRAQYVDPDSASSRHSLNVLCVRLVFCLFAEDAGLFPKNAFYHYLKGLPAALVRGALKELFSHLHSAPEDRDPYACAHLKEFPYVNGGLFEGDVEIPNFTEEILEVLLEEVSRGTNWAEISPTIFGGVFESTLNPQTRRAGGMHYTSPENIHRVIDPLFLDDLTNELNAILTDTNLGQQAKRNRLKKYHNKLASLHFFDPACGSGNFLTETYTCMRRLENRVLSELMNHQGVFGFTPEDSPLKISLSQFHGIEINDFAVSVATTALWIAELQANAEAQSIVYQIIEDLPLKDSAHIVLGNALNINWSKVLPPAQCDYIIGNPPFIGYSNLNPEQKTDRLRVLGKNGGILDYVACWYKKAADYMKSTPIQAALVSTNSICQGQQVQPLWQPLFNQGLHINFAHRTFVWSSESSDQAHVHVVIIGFAYQEKPTKHLFQHHNTTTTKHKATHINAYLLNAPHTFIVRRSRPLSDVAPMVAGGKPSDGGFLILNAKERADLLHAEPEIEPWIRRYSMGAEFINGIDRYCLWLADCPRQVWAAMPKVADRVRAVQHARAESPKEATRKKAETPWLFDEIKYRGEGPYLAIPKVSSERRKYIPIGFVTDGMIPGDKLFFIPEATVYDFGIMTSRVHNAWMRVVAGRLESRYSYGNTIVYNNFIWPQDNDAQRQLIAEAAQGVLAAREIFSGTSLKDLYDPDKEFIYPELVKAHRTLDAAVEHAYGLDPECTEEEIVAHLFKLYTQATKD